MPETVRKLATFVALVALLLPSISALAGTLSAADLPACCNTSYCPVHHRQAKDIQKDKSDCNAIGMPGHDDCSMRACDASPSPAVGTFAFVLVTPVALRSPAIAETAPSLASQFFSSASATPITPPPRSFPS